MFHFQPLGLCHGNSWQLNFTTFISARVCQGNRSMSQPYLLGYDMIKELCCKHICFGILWQLNHAPNISWHVLADMVDGIILMKTARINFT